MNRYMTLRSGNPAFTAHTFRGIGHTGETSMTIMGTVRKTVLSLSLLIITAAGGIAFIYLISFVPGFFNIQVPVIPLNTNMGILFSLGVVVTLIWLYLELLRLLAKLQSRRK